SSDQLVGSCEQEIGVPEPLHDEEHLGVAGDSLLTQPGAQGRLVRYVGPLHALVPPRQSDAGPAQQKTGLPPPPPLPTLRLSHPPSIAPRITGGERRPAHPAPSGRAAVSKYRLGFSTSICVICSVVTPWARRSGSTSVWMWRKCQFGNAAGITHLSS